MASTVAASVLKSMKRPAPFRELHGVVVSSGLQPKTIKVRVGGTEWNNFLKKSFNKPKTYLVHDPADSVRTGDVVAITPGERTSKMKRHVVKSIIAPAGVPAEERPAVPTEDQRWADRVARKIAKEERKVLRDVVERAERSTVYADQMLRRAQRETALRQRLMVTGGGGRPAAAGAETEAKV
ncbi:hypothetical protein B0T17DRAFT_584811 [Bombardia bombarda]|uniref:Ribosomal protein S17 n=1 Tax=Bombardia bombarda TaxID=252184 RepID=A0AA39U2M9_9PEZI|nr:hypothetical protein B0T17DRAFT_584811 [Bombardia bombarda]